MFDLTAFEGMARTRYVLDASCVSAATLAANSTVSGAGTVTLSPLNVAGGRITMSTGSNDMATVTYPVQFGSTQRSVLAWMVEVEGLSTNGIRGTVRVEAAQTAGSGNTGLAWSDNGVRMNTTAPDVTLPTIQEGSFQDMSNGRAGVLVDASGGTTSAVAYGYLGGTMVRTGQGVHTAGFLSGRIRSVGATPGTAEVSFRRLTVTVIWGVPGDTLTQVLA